MTDIKLFSLKQDSVYEIPGSAVEKEQSLQDLIDANLESFLGIRFLESQYSTGTDHGGRIDTLGIDENANPVIIEYKRATNENVLNQVLFYLKWLLQHRADFKVLVMEKLGPDAASAINWSAPRLLCIAGGFSRYDKDAAQLMNQKAARIELIRYRRFGGDLLMLELVNPSQAVSSTTKDRSSVVPGLKQKAVSGSKQKTQSKIRADLDGPLRDLYQAVQTQLMALGDDIREVDTSWYIAFKRRGNFASIVIRPTKKTIAVYLKVDPKTVKLEKGFSRDVRDVGHYGTGDLEITLRSMKDLKKAKTFLKQSYKGSSSVVPGLKQKTVSESKQKTQSEIRAGLDGPLRDLYQAVQTQLMALGDDVREVDTSWYIAFKRRGNFASIVIRPTKKTIAVYLKVDPKTVKLEKGFSRDVRDVGHYGTGDLEITLRSMKDLKKAKTFLKQSYNVNQ